MDTIGDRIKIALRERDMKQSELANLTGIHKSAISSYISGKYEPKQNAIFQMAKALNVNEAWLMGYDDVDMERDPIPRTKEGILEYFHKHPELKVLFSIVGDLSDEDIDFLIEMARKMKRG
jgi:transcriptional regulator with XRE-family HTH domain